MGMMELIVVVDEKEEVNIDEVVILVDGVTFGFVFFFQAEDGIRDRTVTGVQTCALPICEPVTGRGAGCFAIGEDVAHDVFSRASVRKPLSARSCSIAMTSVAIASSLTELFARSEERRVGKECRSRWAAERDREK